jgi:hypothetical protein
MSEVSCVLKQLPNVTTYMCLEEDVSSPVMYPIICGLLLRDSHQYAALAFLVQAEHWIVNSKIHWCGVQLQ